MSEMKATGTDNVVAIPTQRAQTDDSTATVAELLLRLVERIDAHPTPLSRTESKRKDGKTQHRFNCPHCNAVAAGAAYEGKKRVTLYCDRKCGATRMLAALDLDRQALTGRPDLLSTVPPNFRRIDVTNEVETILAVTEVIRDGVLPHVYERNGSLVSVTETSEDVKVKDLGEHDLRSLLTQHTFTYRTSGDGDAVRHLPSPTTCSTILATPEWHGVEQLRGVIHTPALRPDGTVIQRPGFDRETGLYLAGNLEMGRPIPDRPTSEDIKYALDLLLNWMLHDFPWVDHADRANCLAFLLTELLRPRLSCPAPLAGITAPDRGSGKTFLAATGEILYGGRQYTWPENDAEMRKQITTMLRESTAPVLVFDNVPAERVVEYPAFAGLLTRRTWSDRLLGQSREVEVPNDRTWAVTGTNLRFGGDLGSRSYLIAIDPKRPRPDRRTDFRIKNYESWVKEKRVTILKALLILARAWAADGAPEITYAMRGFTPWAQQIGGLLAFHNIEGFLDNANMIDVHDEEMDTWSKFFAAWYERHGSTPKRLSALMPDDVALENGDPSERDWAEIFPRTGRGDRYVGRNTLGSMLRERKGRFYGTHAVQAAVDHKGHDAWKIVKYEAPTGSASPETEPTKTSVPPEKGADTLWS